MSRRLIGLAATAAAVLVMTACGADNAERAEDLSAVSSTTTTQSSTKTSSTTPSATTSSAAPASPPVETAPVTGAVAAQPTLVECVYGGGAWTTQGWMSDGTFQEHPACVALRAEQMSQNPYRCPRTDHYVADLSECGVNLMVPPSDETSAAQTPSDQIEPESEPDPAPTQESAEEVEPIP